MKLETLYRKAVAAGMAKDPRGPEAVRRLLDDERTACSIPTPTPASWPATRPPR